MATDRFTKAIKLVDRLVAKRVDSAFYEVLGELNLHRRDQHGQYWDSESFLRGKKRREEEVLELEGQLETVLNETEGTIPAT